MESCPLHIPAYAKINLSLEVIGRRDDGYHDVVTILQTVDLADTLTLSVAGELVVTCDAPELQGQDNIVWAAATRLAERAGIPPHARIHVSKRIPVAAGLGGGSADAASALWGLNRLWGLGLAAGHLVSIAAELGSDVPFLITGGTALGTGRGDEITMLPDFPSIDVLVVAPSETIPAKTLALYRALTADDFSDGRHTKRLADGITTHQLTTNLCRNTFERPAKAIFPGLADVWDRVAAAAQHPPRLSGAGPALFCLPSSENERTRVVAALQGTGATAYLVRTLSPATDAGIDPTV